MNTAFALKANFSIEEDMSGIRGVTIFPINPTGKEDEPTYFSAEALWSLKCLIDELEGELNISSFYNRRMREWADTACKEIKYRIAERVNPEDIISKREIDVSVPQMAREAAEKLPTGENQFTCVESDMADRRHQETEKK